MIVALTALAAAAQVLFGVLLIARLRKPSVLLGALFIGGVCGLLSVDVSAPTYTGGGLIYALSWGALQDLALFTLIAATLGLPLLPGLGVNLGMKPQQPRR